MKIKHIISSDSIEFENKINRWLEENKQDTIIDIKYQATFIGSTYGSSMKYSAIIMYKEHQVSEIKGPQSNIDYVNMDSFKNQSGC